MDLDREMQGKSLRASLCHPLLCCSTTAGPCDPVIIPFGKDLQDHHIQPIPPPLSCCCTQTIHRPPAGQMHGRQKVESSSALLPLQEKSIAALIRTPASRRPSAAREHQIGARHPQGTKQLCTLPSARRKHCSSISLPHKQQTALQLCLEDPQPQPPSPPFSGCFPRCSSNNGLPRGQSHSSSPPSPPPVLCVLPQGRGLQRKLQHGDNLPRAAEPGAAVAVTLQLLSSTERINLN